MMIVKQGDTGYYAHDDSETSKTFRFDSRDKAREAYRAAHVENIRRIDEQEYRLLEIGALLSGDWPPWHQGGDPCG